MRARLDVLVEIAQQDGNRDDADRQIDPKHERPVQVLDDKRAQRRSSDRRNAPNPGQPALHTCALGRRIDVADDGCRHRLQRPRAHSLKNAEHDQRRHAQAICAAHGPDIEYPGEAAGGGADEEDGGADKEHALAAVEIGKPSINRRRDRLRQQVGREHPAEQMKAAKLAHNRRHRRRHDRGFHGGHENGHHAGGRYGAPADEKVG